MININERLKTPIIKKTYILLFISVCIFIIKEIFYLMLESNYTKFSFGSLGYIVSASLIIVYCLYYFQKKNNKMLLIVAFIILILSQILFLNSYHSYVKAYTSPYYLIVYIYIIIATFIKPQKGTVATVLLTLLISFFSLINIILIVNSICDISDIEDILYAVFNLLNYSCFLLFDLAILVFIPKAISETKFILNNDTDFEKALVELQKQYIKGNITQEYYDKKRAYILKRL